jgi:hypothetical protein
MHQDRVVDFAVVGSGVGGLTAVMTTPIKQRRADQKPGYYPTTYGVHVDDHTHDYIISLGGLTMRTPS